MATLETLEYIAALKQSIRKDVHFEWNSENYVGKNNEGFPEELGESIDCVGTMTRFY